MIWESSIHVLGDLIVEKAMGISPHFLGAASSSQVWLGRYLAGGLALDTQIHIFWLELGISNLATRSRMGCHSTNASSRSERVEESGDHGPSWTLEVAGSLCIARMRWFGGTMAAPLRSVPIWPLRSRGRTMFSWRGYDQWDLLNGSIYGDTVSLMDIDHIMGIQNGHIIGIQLVYYSWLRVFWIVEYFTGI